MIFLIIRRLFWPFLIFSASYSCVDDDYDKTDPSASFADAREYYEDENYEIALQRLGEFKSRFPYSKHAVEAELLIAKSHFELENFEEAAVEFKQFIKLHPKNKDVPYAMFMVGKSYWTGSPDDIDRDQDLTKTAIKEWQVLLDKYPNSEYSSKAKTMMKEGHRRIAESHLFVVQFYCKQEIFHACAHRAMALLELYPQYKDIKLTALHKAALAFSHLAEQKEEERDSDKNIFFKSLTSQQLSDKAKQFKSLADKLEPN